MLWIPKKAWPALARFAPEKFPLLQLRFEAMDPGSDEYKTVAAELENLVAEFTTWAQAFLAQERQAELLALGGREQVTRNIKEKFWAPRLMALAGADLTTTEYDRLMRHLDRLIQRPVTPVVDALKALEKPWRYRDSSFHRPTNR